jgi:hypothetical protein
MRRSTKIQLTLLPILASAALAHAQAPGQTEPMSNAPGNTVPTPSVLVPAAVFDRLDMQMERCRQDPNLPECHQPVAVVRGGFGGYFSRPGGGNSSGG